VSLLKWLGITEQPDVQVNSLGEIERALTELPPAEARYVAAFAYILHRIARADHEISDAESALIEQLVATRGGLDSERARLVVTIARTENLRHGGTEDFIVTREFEKSATREQKVALLDCLFAVSAIDESIRTVEDNEIRRVASEIKLDHTDYIAVRAAHAAHLASRK
jgi:uncharacterized tellurite resistance protein B-like protein